MHGVQVLSVLVRYIVESNDESMAILGVSLLQQLVQAAVTQTDDKGWDCIVTAFQNGCSFDSLQRLLSDEVARYSSSCYSHLPGLQVTAYCIAEEHLMPACAVFAPETVYNMACIKALTAFGHRLVRKLHFDTAL